MTARPQREMGLLVGRPVQKAWARGLRAHNRSSAIILCLMFTTHHLRPPSLSRDIAFLHHHRATDLRYDISMPPRTDDDDDQNGSAVDTAATDTTPTYLRR